MIRHTTALRDRVWRQPTRSPPPAQRWANPAASPVRRSETTPGSAPAPPPPPPPPIRDPGAEAPRERAGGRPLEEADERHGNPARVDEKPVPDLDPLDHHDHGDRAEQEPEDELAQGAGLGPMGREPAADVGIDEQAEDEKAGILNEMAGRFHGFPSRGSRGH